MSARRSPPASRRRRAEAEDLAAAVDGRLRAARRGGRCTAARAGGRAGARILGRQPVHRADDRRRRHRSGGARRPRSPSRREYRMNRQSGSPMECRGGARLSRPPARRGRGLRLDPDAAHDARRARRDPRASRSAGSGSSRPMSAAASGPRRGSIRKRSSSPRWRCELDHPVRWIEDRNEHLLTARAYPRPSLQGHRLCRPAAAGSSASIARSPSMPAPMACGRRAPTRKPTWRRAPCPGPTRSRITAPAPVTVATNKAPIGPYRGVGRPGACFAVERTIDEVARAVGRDPVEVRIENMIPPEQMPYTSVTGMRYDTGDYAGKRAALRRAAEPAGRSAHASSAASRTAG